MNRVVRDRLLLPIAIPVGASLLILVLVLAFSRVLLRVPGEMAVAVALMVAVNILLACAVVATRPRIRPPDLLLLLGVAFVPIALGGMVAAGLVGPPEPPGPGPPPPVTVDIAAANTAFDLSEIALEAGRPAVIRLNNQDTVPHNVAIYSTPEAQELIFRGDIIQGGTNIEYRFNAPAAESYFFRCDVHPVQMTGTVVVREAAPEGPEAGPPGVEIAAQNLAFDQTEFTLPSEERVVIRFDNQETVPHNVAIYRTPEAQEADLIFRGQTFPGPAVKEYGFTSPSSGSYFFRCDVHPAQMTGTVTFG